MKYILTVLAAVSMLSACCTKQCDTRGHGVKTKASADDSCCKADGQCTKKH